MIIVLKQHAPADKVQAFCNELNSMGFQINDSVGSDTHILGLIGDTKALAESWVLANPVVETCRRVSEPYKKANRKFHPDDTIVDVGGHKIGGGYFAVMSGPCSVESKEQITYVAQRVQAAGASILRGGAFKPRTSPYSFQGLRAEGLELLQEARKVTGQPIVTELMNNEHIPLFLDAKVDMIQIGARNMQEEPELLTGHDLTAYEDHIRSALVKYRMPEETTRGIMHWYDTPDSVNDKVRSVTFNVERRNGKLWGIAECQISGELSAAELTTLKEYIEGQASDGWGEGFEQHEIAVGRGSELYVHLWQDYGWSIQTEQERFCAHFDKLPEMCFTLLPGTGQLICIKRGESGYYPSDWSTGDAHENRRIADEQNRKRGVTPAQEEAMKIGSMCGWDVPGADPDNCEDIVQRRGRIELG